MLLVPLPVPPTLSLDAINSLSYALSNLLPLKNSFKFIGRGLPLLVHYPNAHSSQWAKARSQAPHVGGRGQPLSHHCHHISVLINRKPEIETRHSSVGRRLLSQHVATRQNANPFFLFYLLILKSY